MAEEKYSQRPLFGGAISSLFPDRFQVGLVFEFLISSIFGGVYFYFYFLTDEAVHKTDCRM